MAGELTDLVSHPEALLLLNNGIARAVAKSFSEDKFNPTMSEIRRRFSLCLDVFRLLHSAPFHWSTIRIVDEMGHALRHKLDGIPWDPSIKRVMYVPGGNYERFMR